MHLEIDVTNRCNLKCSYCYNRDYLGNLDISGETIRGINKLINSKEPSPEFPTRIDSIVFMGGEPLLNFDAIKQIEKPSKWRIVTNLTHITPEIATWIKIKGGKLQVSLDGIRYVHNKYRGFHKEICENIKKYLPLIENVRMTILPDTLEYLTESISFISSLGIRSVSPVFCREIPDTYDWENYRKQLKDIRKIPISNKIIRDISRKSFRKQCGAGLGLRSIDVLGNSYICHRFNRLKIKDPIIVDPNKECYTCICKDVCVGTCLYTSYVITGRFNGLSSVFCNYMKYSFKELSNEYRVRK